MTEETPERRDHLCYDPERGSLLLATGDRGISVTGLAPEVVFERLSGEGPAQWALYATADEIDVLAKMIAYVLEKVRISEASREALAALLPRVEALRERSRSSASTAE